MTYLRRSDRGAPTLEADDRGQRSAGIVTIDDALEADADHVGKRRTDVRIGAALLAAIVLFAAGVVIAQPGRAARVAEDRASPTFSRNDSGTPLPTEAEVWGAIWSRTQGPVVLRPTWLPRNSDEYQVGELGGPSVRHSDYGVFYVERHSQPGSAVWSVEFLADAATGNAQHFGGAGGDVAVRRTTAKLFGNGLPGWTLEWTEGGFGYAVEAFGVSREDLIRIVASLAPVVDATGRTAPHP